MDETLRDVKGPARQGGRKPQKKGGTHVSFFQSDRAEGFLIKEVEENTQNKTQEEEQKRWQEKGCKNKT